jgi:mRNA interferase HigB
LPGYAFYAILIFVIVIAFRTLREFWEVHVEDETALRYWNKLVRSVNPINFAELKATFGSVDLARAKDDTVIFIFDVGGNNYRIFTRIDFEYRVLFILKVLTHRNYDRWNKEGRPT